MTASRLFAAVAGVFLVTCGPAFGGMLSVPGDHKTIQAALDAARPGDTVLVAAGTYRERVRLKPGVTLRSAGDDRKGQLGLKRAEATVIDGGGKSGQGPGVSMAERSTLDGFTVINVGRYDDAEWKKHHATQGEEQSHAHIGQFGTPGVGISGADCTVRNCIVHHNGFTGIAIRGTKGRRCSPLVQNNVCYRNMGGGIGSVEGSTAVIRGNICFQNFFAGIGHDNASPLVVENTCYENIRAGIGISHGARPLVRGNRCYRNRRAGIGIRTGAETSPLVTDNDCYENDMAGIGCRDRASPVIRGNRCYRNRMAGIGSRDGARAVIEKNRCYENSMAGIGSRLGAAPVIRNNRCYRNKLAGIGAREKATPLIEANECYENDMAGIGCRTEAAPVIRNNRCYRNGMAGIGSRRGAKPVIVGNDCYENKLAGIGSREGAVPVIRGNRCYRNQRAGIGNRSGARPVIVENESRENKAAGIGVRSGAVAVIVANRCIENRLVAIGVPDGATAFIHGNRLSRTGGVPPLVAVRGGSSAMFSGNLVRGGGVAGLLVQGTVRAVGNRFEGRGAKKQGSAIWAWDGSQIVAADNRFDGYRNALNAAGSKVTAAGNVVSGFLGTAVVVRKPARPARVSGTTAVSASPKDKAVTIDGKPDAGHGNIVIAPEKAKGLLVAKPELWPDASRASPWRKPGDGRSVSVQDGRWKLVAISGKSATRYRLYDLQSDPMQTHDLAKRLEQITFRLRGLLERKEAAENRPDVGPRPRRAK